MRGPNFANIGEKSDAKCYTQEAVPTPLYDDTPETEAANWERFVLKAFPDSITFKQLRLAYELSKVLNTANIQIDGAEERIAVQSYLPTITSNRTGDQNAVVAWHENETETETVSNPAILARFIPGARLGSDISPTATSRLAELHAKVHGHFRDPALLRLAEVDDSLKIMDTQGYMDRFTRQTPEILRQMPETWKDILRVTDAAFQRLPQGVVPTSFWMGDVMFKGERPSGLVDINETEYTSPLLCLGMSLWGLYAAKGGDIEPIMQYMATYQQHRELSPYEQQLWPHFMLARAIMCWQGAKLVEPLTAPGEKSAAKGDEERIIKLFADLRERRLIPLWAKP
ncbi:MAG TPA: hypothetical protein VLG16_00480 [Candidatus Saccharimonadales bacterium]|nr:hypothetical protein [Candidatus Saccharimonadales bacterium]